MRSLAETGNCDQYSWSEGAGQPIPTESLFLTASIKRQGFDWRKKGTSLLSKLCFENQLGTGRGTVTPKLILLIALFNVAYWIKSNEYSFCLKQILDTVELFKFQFLLIVGFLLICGDANSWMCRFSVSIRTLKPFKICCCQGCKFSGEGYPRIPWKLSQREFLWFYSMKTTTEKSIINWMVWRLIYHYWQILLNKLLWDLGERGTSSPVWQSDNLCPQTQSQL